MSLESEPMNVVECSAVSRAFVAADEWRPAVNRVTCVVARHARIALLGASGSGKSTLLHLLAQLDRPTDGFICWPGMAAEPHRSPGEVGVVFQAPSLIDSLTVLENVSLPLLVLGDRSDEAVDAAAQLALESLGLGHLSLRLPAELSAGQAQRVAIARAIASSPRLLLADEPTGRLDNPTAQVVLRQLVSAATRSGAALVVATHDASVAAHLEDAWFMTDGRLSSSIEVTQ